MNLRKQRAKLTGRGAQLKIGFVAGHATPDTARTVTGIKLGDELVCCIELRDNASATRTPIVADRTAVTKITAADEIKVNANTLADPNNQLLVIWSSVR